MDFIQYHFWFWSVLFTSMLDQSLKKKVSPNNSVILTILWILWKISKVWQLNYSWMNSKDSILFMFRHDIDVQVDWCWKEERSKKMLFKGEMDCGKQNKCRWDYQEDKVL